MFGSFHLMPMVSILTGHLHLAAEPYKMSKSRFNTIEVTELLEMYTANQFRLFCLMEPYNKRQFQIVVSTTFNTKNLDEKSIQCSLYFNTLLCTKWEIIRTLAQKKYCNLHQT